MACAFAVVVFVWSMAFFYLPGMGFTYLIQFGSREHAKYLPEVRAVSHYEAPDSKGYDSQWYVQIAVQPDLKDPRLVGAVDSLPYRARRILFLWTAWAMGAANPSRVIEAYAVQNIVCWFLLAALLLRWFPPSDWGNVLRWGATLYSFGLIFSIRGALLDGPSLFLVAGGMALVEAGRTWLGAAALGLAGLGKDTSVLSGVGLPRPQVRRPRSLLGWGGRTAVVVGPIILWVIYLRGVVGSEKAVGARNFSMPFCGLADKMQDILSSVVAEWRYPFPTVTKFDALVLVGLLAQALFFLLRIRWRDPWWRIGASYAVLMAFLGDAVWESYPSAAARVLLPMALAFNISVPRGRLWPLVLIVGNLGAFGSVDLLKPPGRESYVVEGPRELRVNPKDGNPVTAVFGPVNWWRPEKSRWDYFRWSMGDSSVAIHNPQNFSMTADIIFKLRSVDRRAAIITLDGRQVRREELEPAQVVPVTIKDVLLPPGDTIIVFKSDRPAAYPGNADKRRLTYMVRDLEIDLEGRAPGSRSAGAGE